MINFYRSTFALLLGGGCRFEPSCSKYAVEAFQKHSFIEALRLTVIRLSKCRPGGAFGLDPVPCLCHERENIK